MAGSKFSHLSVLIATLACASLGVIFSNAAPTDPSRPAKPSFQQELARLKIPPDWLETTRLTWDTNRPWKDARLEVRRLLAGSDDQIRQAVKITWIYAQKKDINDGHELSMYLFMSGNYAWANLEFPKYLKTVEGKGPTHAYLSYASCLAHFGEFVKAIEVCEKALTDLPPKPWRTNSMAGVHSEMGDIYAEAGDLDKAKQHYAEAIKLFPASEQPYGRHLLARRAAQVQAKLDMLTMASLSNTPLRDGTYIGKALGYSDKKDMAMTVTIRGGKIAEIKVDHEEKIEMGACKTVPEKIIAMQSLKVDAVTGATVTSRAIIEGTFSALKQAGLK